MYVNGRRPRRGVGALVDPSTAPLFSSVPGSSGHGTCSSNYWNFNPLAYFDNACRYPAPPAPAAPSTTLVPNGGVDVLGNPTYDVLTQSAADNQAAYVAAVGDFMDTVGAANPPPAPPSATPTSWLVLGAVALGLVAVSVMSGRGH